MGIVNLTDNSFVEESRLGGLTPAEVVDAVERKFALGADIVDIGACSSAPGNAEVSPEVEWGRLEAGLEAVFEALPDRIFSIDTFRGGVALGCLRVAQKHLIDPREQLMINDIKAGSGDPVMLPFISSSGLQYIAMDRTDNPLSFFMDFAARAEKEGVQRWILDPGFGFGKSVERNWEILRNLRSLKVFGKKILVGVSRKRMIWQEAGLNPQSCRPLSVEAEKFAINSGADIVRTHDLEYFY